MYLNVCENLADPDFAVPLDYLVMMSSSLIPPVLSSALFFFAAGVASLTLDPAQPLIPKPPATVNSSDLSASASLANVQLAPSSNLSHLLLQCDPYQFGDDLSYTSCRDAYNQIPHLIAEMTWGPRTQGRWSVNLPWRVYSCELTTT